MKSYCINCNKVCGIRVVTKPETFKVKGDPIEITARTAFCKECGEEVSHPEIDNNNLNLAFDEYRKKNGLLTREEIIGVRTKYNLSQRALAKLLDWGEVTINRYEKGALQDAVHNEVLELINKPENMKRIFLKNGKKLADNYRTRLGNRIDELINSEKDSFYGFYNLQDGLLGGWGANEYTGYRDFSLEKMMAMIWILLKESKGVFETKLNKLLWYSDFLYFKEYSNSISGCPYVHLTHGPVPDYYKFIVGATSEEGFIREEEVDFKDYSGTKYYAENTLEKDILSKEEVDVIIYIARYFYDFTAEQIKNRSHEEKGYQETADKEKISYVYAADLTIEYQ